jgi:hypothetical protein
LSSWSPSFISLFFCFYSNEIYGGDFVSMITSAWKLSFFGDFGSMWIELNLRIFKNYSLEAFIVRRQFCCHPYGALSWGLFQKCLVDCQWYWISLLYLLCNFVLLISSILIDEFSSQQKQNLEIISTRVWLQLLEFHILLVVPLFLI